MWEISNFPTLNVHSKCCLLHMSRGKYISTVRFPFKFTPSHHHIFTARTPRKHTTSICLGWHVTSSSTNLRHLAEKGQKVDKSSYFIYFSQSIWILPHNLPELLCSKYTKKHFIKKLSFHFLEQQNRPASTVASNIVGQMLQNFHFYFSEARGRSFY